MYITGRVVSCHSELLPRARLCRRCRECEKIVKYFTGEGVMYREPAPPDNVRSSVEKFVLSREKSHFCRICVARDVCRAISPEL